MSDVNTWAPYYPNAEVVSQDYDFIVPRTMGTGATIMVSPDDVETVKQYYRDLTIENLQGNKQRGLAATDWQVEENPDGEGSQIILSSVCGI